MLSCVALRLACMCGKATLAMVVSSTCSRTAIITATVTMIRSPAGSGWVTMPGPWSAICLAGGVEVDGGDGRQAGNHRPRRRAVESDPHRHTLRHLDPIAVGIL